VFWPPLEPEIGGPQMAVGLYGVLAYSTIVHFRATD
jgi:hypothetical protein